MDERYYICDKDNNEIVYGYIDYNRMHGFKIKPGNNVPYEGVEVSRLVLVEPTLIENVLKRKTKHKLNAYLSFLFTVIDDDDEDPDSLELVIDDVTRYKNIIMNKYSKFLDKKYIKQLLKKVGMVELELKDKLESTGHIKVVLQTKIDSEETFNTLKSKAVENNWEGLMLRKDDFYKGKRSFDLLKYKEFSDAEYIVKSIELGVKPMLIDGTMKDVECVSALHIEHKGYDVKVGSGLIDSQRIEWKEHPENIIGKTIKVKYFEETIDQNGNISLRFPILLMVYENGRFD